jgi:hypothetical protein
MTKFSSCEIRDIPNPPNEMLSTLMMWANDFGLRGLKIEKVEKNNNCLRLILDDEKGDI